MNGKGGKRRWLPVTDPRVGLVLLQRPGGFVWPGRFGGHVHEATLRRKVRQSTGVPPHALRRRFASQAYAGSGDLLALQLLLGHASPATTQLYSAFGASSVAGCGCCCVSTCRGMRGVGVVGMFRTWVRLNRRHWCRCGAHRMDFGLAVIDGGVLHERSFCSQATITVQG